MICWNKKMRFSAQARKNAAKIMKRVSKRSLKAVTSYCIALPSNKENLLDIMNTGELLFSHYRDSEDPLVVIGLAESRESAIELSRSIIEEVYRETGGLDLEAYFGDN